MAFYLAKTEPAEYSILDLEREKRTTWDGVRNPQAVKAIRAMQLGDEVLIYHSGKEEAIVGVAKVLSEPRPDPNDTKSWVVELGFVRHLTRPIPLREIKESHLFDDWSLVRQSRLSTMPVPEEFIAWLQQGQTL
ncbi:putative RNA-binding protein with PUA-like domain [Thermosporothrix hazakensis]|jgi:predicted RNA-binding protein with PUA-like domain|uniref:Putative RNA-binding protein with PUA-like domain n=1 Tax=Thermosporothrix hazakensis TaxID=644383 RepID=A0A326UM62_THEHA|nr:EVE domain-containing protein [Thermosporothrix hazakensis]PZW30674.1 putative RNA-binding protein with PUA-like domain [Thermosporothrix hazakensis]GCE49536.1 ubiquinol-cytochrome c reductase [Thermosporothrix hazakensis]